MKIKINGYEININARYENSNNKRCNKEDTLAIINYIGLLASDSYHRNLEKNYNGLANHAKQTWDEIYNQLNENGYYNNL